MFAIERIRRLPLAMLLGLTLMVAGGVADVVVHLGPADNHPHAGFAAEHAAHVVGLAGMSLVLAGVVTHGARRQSRRRRAAITRGGPDSHDHR
jgi:membrane associated rhomboid family serine protease